MRNPQSPARSFAPRRRLWAILAAGCAVLALFAACGAALAGWSIFSRRGPAVSSPAVEYVLDASARMALPADNGGGSRLAVAQAVLAEILRPVAPAVTAGLRVFGTGAAAPGCTDTKLLVPLAPASQAKIADRLLAVSTGSQADAALAAAVVAALRDLARTPGPRTLVVVTGGADSCSNQAGALIVAEAKRDGIDYQLFVIGFQVPDDQGSTLTGLVDNLGTGHFINTRTRDELAAVLTAIQNYVDDQKATTVAGVLATAEAAGASAATSAPSTPVPPTAAAATPTPTATRVSAASVTLSPTPDLAPKVNSFLARFDEVQRATFYSVTVSLDTAALVGAPPVLTYRWTNSNPCGQFTGVTSPMAEWRHPDVPGSCPNEPVHPGVITVVVGDAYGAVYCVYNGGSAPGNSAQCQAVPK